MDWLCCCALVHLSVHFRYTCTSTQLVLSMFENQMKLLYLSRIYSIFFFFLLLLAHSLGAVRHGTHTQKITHKWNFSHLHRIWVLLLVVLYVNAKCLGVFIFFLSCVGALFHSFWWKFSFWKYSLFIHWMNKMSISNGKLCKTKLNKIGHSIWRCVCVRGWSSYRIKANTYTDFDGHLFYRVQ